MINDFWFYFTEGWKHIISWGALDHQLFILALAVIYTFTEWKKVLILVTAFTIGHSVTLVLSVLDIIRINGRLVEFLIPITIILTAVWNILFARNNQKKINTNYFLALFFGLIHGLGFANSIRIMLASNQSLGVGLFSFNAGLEVGQIVMVLFILAFTKLFTDWIKVPRSAYIVSVSIFILIISANIAINRITFLS
jgi:hypothetical protein